MCRKLLKNGLVLEQALMETELNVRKLNLEARFEEAMGKMDLVAEENVRLAGELAQEREAAAERRKMLDQLLKENSKVDEQMAALIARSQQRR